MLYAGKDLTFPRGKKFMSLAKIRIPFSLNGFRLSGNSTNGKGGLLSGFRKSRIAFLPAKTFNWLEFIGERSIYLICEVTKSFGNQKLVQRTLYEVAKAFPNAFESL